MFWTRQRPAHAFAAIAACAWARCPCHDMTTARTQPVFPVVRPSPWRARLGVGRASPLHLTLAALLVLFFLVLLIWPIFNVVMTGFRTRDGGFTLDYLRLILTNPVLLRGLLNSTIVAVLTTALALVIALPLAVLSVRYDFRGRGIMSGLLLVPMILPPFFGAVGMRVVLARYVSLT